MRVVALLLLGLGAWFPGQSQSAELPPEIVGVWATPETEFDASFNLLGGLALYVASSGVVAVGGAPLPVMRNAGGQVVRPLIGIGGSATYDAATARLTITLQSGSQSRSVVADYKAVDRTISMALEAAQPSKLSRRSAVVPEAMERAVVQPPQPESPVSGNR